MASIIDNTLHIEVRHRSNEDFSIFVPIRNMDKSLVPGLGQATALCVLKSKSGTELTFASANIQMSTDGLIINRKGYSFSGVQPGRWKGDVLVRLADGTDFSPIVIILDLTEGVTQWPQ